MAGLRGRLEQHLQRRWYSRSANPLLLPLSWCYGRAIKGRRQRIESHDMSVPVVVVGNITVGGTGKSPLVMALAQLLEAADFRPAVLTRGYGGRAAHYPRIVTGSEAAVEVGDEALLLAQALDCPVLVDPDRVRGARALIRDENPDIILCDDGLQHYALQRDLELLVIDATRGLGNGQLLPAGPLRESATRIDAVDMVLCNGNSAQLDEALRRKIHYEFNLRPSGWRHLASGETFELSARPFGHRIHAVAGIGNPQRFFKSLTDLGFEVECHARPDHFLYHREDLPADGVPVVMTAKDAVKCRAFAAANWWVLEVEAELPAALADDFMQRCEVLISRSAE